MVIDAVTFNGEFDLLEIRMRILNDHVDQFVVVEFDKTFSGKDKPTYVMQQKEWMKKFESKLKFFYVSESTYSKYKELAESSPNTKGADHWKREFMQKESIKDCLETLNLKHDDIVYLGDCDEIWDSNYEYGWTSEKLKLRVYSYYLNNRSSETFWGTLVCHWGTLKNNCLNHFRANPSVMSKDYWGWHFTSMGGYEEVKRKLSDSYTRESYWTSDVENNLKSNIENNRDFLFRGFSYSLSESDLPKYLLDNREKYTHLFYDPPRVNSITY